jgi:hypothetical protein
MSQATESPPRRRHPRPTARTSSDMASSPRIRLVALPPGPACSPRAIPVSHTEVTASAKPSDRWSIAPERSHSEVRQMAPNARLIAPLNKERAVTMGASRSGRAALSPSVARGTRWNLARGRAGTFASIGSANVCSSSLLQSSSPPLPCTDR